MREGSDAQGWSYRAVELRRGGLVIVGHDLGGTYDEYEFERRLSPDETAELGRLLGVPRGSLLDAIETRFTDTVGLEAFCREHGLEGEFWNRIG